MSMSAILFAFVSLPIVAEAPAVVELFEDDVAGLSARLTCDRHEPTFALYPPGSLGTLHKEAKDIFSGSCSVRVETALVFEKQVKGWNFPIVEKPGKGQYRYVRFACKKSDKSGLMIQFHDNESNHRYVAGPNPVGGEAVTISKEPVIEWTVVTRDLYKDFGEFHVRGLALAPLGGGAALIDHVYLAAAVEDLDRVSVTGEKVKTASNEVERGRFWEDLRSADAGTARRAMLALANQPERTLPFLKDKLAALLKNDDSMSQRIKELDDDDFSVREAAMQALTEMGQRAEPHLRQARKSATSPEATRRLAALLEALHSKGSLTAEQWQILRVSALLRRMDSDEARKLLKSIQVPLPKIPLSNVADD